jgi:hypothetical protein
VTLALQAVCQADHEARHHLQHLMSALLHSSLTHLLHTSYTPLTHLLHSSLLNFAAMCCRCPCTYQRSPPLGGGVPSTCCSSASASSVSWLQLASTMVQSGPTGDGDCPWDWLLFLLSYWEWVPCSCQTLLTHLCSVERWNKPARFLRVTEVSMGLSHQWWHLTST